MSPVPGRLATAQQARHVWTPRRCVGPRLELDQRWLVDHAGDRAEFICQSQSLNVFLPADVQKKTLHDVHWRAWEKGVKSLYYCRSKSVARAESHASESVTGAIANTDTLPANGNAEPLPLAASGEDENDYEECLSCQ